MLKWSSVVGFASICLSISRTCIRGVNNKQHYLIATLFTNIFLLVNFLALASPLHDQNPFRNLDIIILHVVQSYHIIVCYWFRLLFPIFDFTDSHQLHN